MTPVTMTSTKHEDALDDRVVPIPCFCLPVDNPPWTGHRRRGFPGATLAISALDFTSLVGDLSGTAARISNGELAVDWSKQTRTMAWMIEKTATKIITIVRLSARS